MSANAAYIHSFDSYLGGTLAAPQALAVDQATGDLYVIEHDSGCVSRYHGDRGGPEALEPHDFPATGTNEVCGVEYREPPYFFGDGTANAQVAIDNSGTATEGKFYVNSPGPNTEDPAVTLGFDAEGNLETELTERRTPEDFASLRWPCGVATDDAGNVYVNEALYGVQKYNHDDPVTDDDFEGEAGGTWPACYLSLDSTGAYHAFLFAGTVDRASGDEVYSTEGSVVKGATAEGLVFDEFGAGQVTESHGVAIDESNGVAYVSDTANGRVAVFKATKAHRLDVNLGGTGLGAVSANVAPLESCGDEGPCVGYYADSTLVLKATPQVHSVIGGWSGCDDVSLDGTECTVEIAGGDRAVTTDFTRIQRSVSATTAGSGGSVSDADPLGPIQSCGDGGGCSGAYDEGSQVELIATPVGHSTFSGWSGDCTNQSGPCKLVVEGEPSVTAHFTAQHAVSIRKAGAGAGAVVSEPSGLDCGAVCVGYFTDGTAVTLSAIPSGHSTFVGWSGAGCSGTGVCEVTAGDATKTVTANFAHDLPSALTDPGATFVGQHVATVHGSVNPNGATVSRCVIEYGTETSYGAQTPCAPSSIGEGEAFVPVGSNLGDLQPGTVYHYRLSATGVGGTAHGQDQTFRTLDDTCDTNEALCPPTQPVEEPKPRKCGKGRVLRKGHCVKRRRHRHRRKHAAHKRRRGHHGRGGRR